MRSLPAIARTYIVGVVLGGLIAILATLPRGIPDPLTAGTLVLFTLLILVADIYSIRLPWGAYVSVSASVIFATVVLFGIGWACLTCAIAIAASNVIRRKPVSRILFNSMGTTIWTAVSACTYLALYDGSVFPLGSFQNAFAVAAYAAVNFLTNTLVLALIIAFTQRLGLLQVWMANIKSVAFQFAMVFPLAVLIVIAYVQWPPWGVVLLTLPLTVLYYSLRSTQQMYHQTIQTIEALADAVDKRDPYTFQHSSSVSDYAERIAQRLRLPVDEISTVVLAARVHDLGKVAVSDSILLKNGPLTPEERERMQGHSAVGAEMVSSLSLYQKGLEYILYHHERYDGKGYPRGLQGESIPLGARIMAVADSYQAMTSDRPYRKALSVETAIEQLRSNRGTQFDAHVVDVFVQILTETAKEEQRTPALTAPVSATS